MGKKVIVELDDELDERFRKAIVQKKGLHKGVIKTALEEAIELWILEQVKTVPEQKARTK